MLCKIYLAYENRAAFNCASMLMSAVGFGESECRVSLMQGKDFIAVLKLELCKFSFEAGTLPMQKCQVAGTIKA